MHLELSVSLPRDARTVPVVRKTLGQALDVLGVESECADDVLLALTEACTNVLDHAAADDDYTVVARLDGDLVTVRVEDTGSGFGESGRDPNGPDLLVHDDAESGRGLTIMRALVDRLHFESRPEQGTVVHLEKQLHWRPDAPLATPVS